MTINTTAHLNFRGQAREALTFYQSVFGGDLVAVTYADAHAVQNPDEADQIMWGQVESPAGFRVMAYDVPGAMEYDRGTIPFFLSIRGDNEAELQSLWQALSEGAEVRQPLATAGWSPLYGMLTDRFGVTWVLDIAVAYNG
ncbi:VOC family protein [Pseudoroseicyclus sp. H15]